jgi:PAS domain S-box-containing protein
MSAIRQTTGGRSNAGPRTPELGKSDADERSHLIAEATQDGIWDWNFVDGDHFWTERVYALLGVTPGAIQPRFAAMEERVHADDALRLERFQEKLLAGEVPAPVELRLQHADGEYRFFTLQGKPLLDDKGRPRRAIGSLCDVTARKQAEMALRESEQRHRALVSVLTSVVWRTDQDGNFVVPQVSWQSYTGQNWEQHAGRGWLNAIHPDDREYVMALWSTAVESKHIYEADGRLWHAQSARYHYFHARAVPMIQRDGSVREWVGVITDTDDRQRAENELKENQERLRQQSELLNLAQDAILVWGRERKITFWNDGAATMYGYSAAEAMGQHVRTFLDSQYPLPFSQIDDEVRRTGRWEGELVHKRKDGTRIFVESRWGMLRDARGNMVGIMEVNRDVSARRHMEHVIRESEERFRTMADAAPVMIWAFDPQKKFHYFNKSLLDFTGRSTDEVSRKGWSEAVYAEDREQYQRTFDTAFERREPFSAEYRLRRADGEYRWVLDHGVPLTGSGGELRGYLGTCLDITHRKGAENKLREATDYLVEQRQWLESLLNLLPVPMLLIDPAAAKVTFNNQAAKLTAALFAAAADATALEYFSDASGNRLTDADSPIQRVSRGERLRGFEMQWHRRDGTRSLIVNAESLPAMHGHARVAMLLYQDITKQKEIEADLRRANQGKDALLAMLGHELRNPLAAITSAAELIGLLDATDPAFGQAREILHAHIQQLVRLVDDMLDVSRLTRGKIRIRRERLDLRNVLAGSLQTCESAIESRRHKVTVAFPDEPLVVEGDAARLEQVFVNLLMNAAKYTDEGGQISVTAESSASEVLVRVRDNGIGITPELLSQVFELFHQLKPSLHRAEGGLGIGLNVVKNLVELHGGSVAAFSEGTGRGSEFVIRLPRSALPLVAPVENAPSGAEGTEAAPTALKVLVVEDNPDVAHSIITLIRHLGHAVESTQDGYAALVLARDFGPDVAFVDIGLPGMSGLDVARSFRQDANLSSAYLIALTGFGQAEDRRRSKEAGFDEHVVKPLSFSRLQELLSGIARSRLPLGGDP